MKKIFLFAVLMMCSQAQSQILDPVKWATSVNKISAMEYELIATAKIEKGWHLYSQTVAKDGPVATRFTFAGNSSYLKKGNTVEETGHTIKDPIFKMEIKYFENKAVFKQRIKLKSKPGFKVNATVEFMVCDNSRCLPPTEVNVVFNVK